MIKNVLKKIVVFILNLETRLIIKKYHPKLIGVTGNVGKTSTKEAITAVMKTKYETRGSTKSYNSDLGVPLTVIDAKTAWGSLPGWIGIVFRGLDLIFTKNDYPEWLVLEVGADRPGDIKNLVKWLKFDVAVVSRLPDVPVHIEFFKDKEAVIDEKMSLPLSIKPDGLIVLNADDPNVMSRLDKIKGKVVLYGFGEKAEVRASNEHITYDNGAPTGFAFDVSCAGEKAPVQISGAVGLHLVYPVLASISVGTALGVELSSAVSALSSHFPPPGRLKIVPGLNGSTILDDTYNSSPIALEAALNTLRQIETTGRKIAVIGNMMELGSHTAEEHKRMGELASGICDLIVTVGVRARFAYESALSAGFTPDKISHFDTSILAGEYLKTIVGAGDIILVKGSQSARMEKAVEQIIADPTKKKQLLVRQDEEWLNR